MSGIAALLEQELESLQLILDERLTELQVLSTIPRPEDKSAELDDLRKQHTIELNLLHAKYKTVMFGPMRGVPSLDQQVQALHATPLFDEEWYKTSNPDVAAAGIDPARHYAASGAFEGRNPGPGFDNAAYYRANPDLAQLGWPALVHYVMYGQAAGRSRT